MFTEDLTPLFADFGVDGTLADVAVRVIFDGPGSPESLGGAGIVAGQPSVTIATEQVPASVFDAELIIPQGTFKVREHLPDGTGVSVLTLTNG